MANGGSIDIKVNFIGLDNIDSIVNQVGQAGGRVGQQFNQVGQQIDRFVNRSGAAFEQATGGVNQTSQAVQGLSNSMSTAAKSTNRTGESVNNLGGYFMAMNGLLAQTGMLFNTMESNSDQALGQLISQGSSAVAVLGQAGMAAKMASGSIAGMLGPIGMAAVAVFQLAQAFRNYDDRINKVNARIEAYKASLSEMTTTFEILAAKQVELSKEEMKNLQELNNEGKVFIETAQELRETAKGIFGQIARIDVKIAEARKQAERQAKNELSLRDRMYSAAGRLLKLEQSGYEVAKEKIDPEKELAALMAKKEKLQEKLNETDEAAIEIAKKGYPVRLKFEQELLKLEERSPLLLKQRAQQEAALLLQLEATKNKIADDGINTRINAFRLEYETRIQQINNMIFATQEARNQALLLSAEIFKAQIEQAKKNEKALARARAQARAKARKAERAKELADQRRREEEEERLLYQVSINRLKLTLDGFEQERAIIEAQYDEQLRLAGENYEKQLIAKQNYLLASRALDKKEEDEELAAFIRRRDAIAAANEEEIRLAIEKSRRINAAQEEVIQGAKDTAKAMALSSVASIASSAAAGDSFNKILNDQLDAIKREAAVQAALNAAYGLAAAAMGEFTTAGARFKAALAFGGVSALAGALGGGGGGGSSSAGGASPTGAPLVSTPDREPVNDNNQPLVFNISMGTVYSTEESALTALTSAITREQNRHRRGAPRNA
jgi:hypothetical protein